ncbi:MAG: hypothetical protein E7J78_02345, partial [Pantoea sp.]|nr:hypothetical protein [Pantoea sp.]
RIPLGGGDLRQRSQVKQRHEKLQTATGERSVKQVFCASERVKARNVKAAQPARTPYTAILPPDWNRHGSTRV